MNFIAFSKELKDFPTFNLKDTDKLSSKVYYHRLVEWQKKGYIQRIANGVFIFADEKLDEQFLHLIANKVYGPSYVSLESAFQHYGFIPEAVYQITSVCTKKTSKFNLDNIIFIYRSHKRGHNFGYKLIRWRNVAIKMAEPEKAIIDYFYLNSFIKTVSHIEELRFNRVSIKGIVDWEKLNNYLTLYENKSLKKRLKILEEWVNNL